MADAFAITTLHVCRTPGEMKDGRVVKEADIKVVPAGTITDLSDEDYATFLKAGAVRRPTKMDRAMAAGGDEPDAVEAIVGRDAAGAAVGDAPRTATVKPVRA